MDLMRRETVDFVIASRTDVLHLSPVIKELRDRNQDSVRIITIQEQGNSLRDMLGALDLSPDVCWTVRGTETRPSLLLAEVYMLLNELWSAAPSSWLMNYGCSRFTYPCVFAAFQNEVSVAHIYDSNSSTPATERELRLQRVVSTVSDLHFTKNTQVKNGLISDGIKEQIIFSVGSTIPDFGREILSNSQLRQKASSEILDAMRKYSDHRNSPKIIAVEVNPAKNLLLEFASLMNDQAELDGDFKIIFFTSYDSTLDRNSFKAKSIQGGIETLSLSHWDRCFLFTHSFCVLSDSPETIDEARAFGALGLLLQEQTKRFDLLSDGHVSLAGSHPHEWLRGVIAMSKKSTSAVEKPAPQFAYPTTGQSAARLIANAITIRKDESAQKSKTLPQFQQAK